MKLKWFRVFVHNDNMTIGVEIDYGKTQQTIWLSQSETGELLQGIDKALAEIDRRRRL